MSEQIEAMSSSKPESALEIALKRNAENPRLVAELKALYADLLKVHEAETKDGI